MNPFSTLARWGRDAWSALTGIPGDVARAGQSIWSFITSVAQVIDFVISNPLLALTLAVQGISALLTGNMEAWRNAGDRLAGYIWGTQVNPVRSNLQAQINALRAWTGREIRGVVHWALLQLMAMRDWVNRLIDAERKARAAGDAAEHKYATQIVAALHQALEREAASGYRRNRSERLRLLVTVLDLAAGRDPAVSAITKRIAGIVLDLAAIDNPLGRLLAGFLLREVIAHLGVDKAIGDLAGQLAGPILGSADPKSLHDVIADLSARVLALENTWAQFMAEGGAQVEQAGEDWRDLTSLATDAALLAFSAGAVAAPAQMASDLAALLRPVGTDTISSVAGLIGKA